MELCFQGHFKVQTSYWDLSRNERNGYEIEYIAISEPVVLTDFRSQLDEVLP